MARKQIKTVNLERLAHRDAKKRLRLAYAYLIEGEQAKHQQISEKRELTLLLEAKK